MNFKDDPNNNNIFNISQKIDQIILDKISNDGIYYNLKFGDKIPLTKNDDFKIDLEKINKIDEKITNNKQIQEVKKEPLSNFNFKNIDIPKINENQNIFNIKNNEINDLKEKYNKIKPFHSVINNIGEADKAFKIKENENYQEEQIEDLENKIKDFVDDNADMIQTQIANVKKEIMTVRKELKKGVLIQNH